MLEYFYAFLIIALSSLGWRISGGLRIKDKKFPQNKLWFPALFGLYGCFYFSFSIENFLIGFLAAYVGRQAFGWGLYLGRLLFGEELDPEKDKECELIDDILYPLHITLKGNSFYLYQYPRLFGFLGTSLSGLIVTFLVGLYLNSVLVMLSGLAMGFIYWIGGLINKLVPEQKGGWGYAEWIFGAYLGLVFAIMLP